MLDICYALPDVHCIGCDLVGQRVLRVGARGAKLLLDLSLVWWSRSIECQVTAEMGRKEVE